MIITFADKDKEASLPPRVLANCSAYYSVAVLNYSVNTMEVIRGVLEFGV